MNAELAISTLIQARTPNRAALRSYTAASEHRSLSPRAQLLAAFRRIGAGVDEKTAQARTLVWYRSSGGDWTRGLS